LGGSAGAKPPTSDSPNSPIASAWNLDQLSELRRRERRRDVLEPDRFLDEVVQSRDPVRVVEVARSIWR
jgi:hypothetical protein